jgi:hypothetical protein
MNQEKVMTKTLLDNIKERLLAKLNEAEKPEKKVEPPLTL